MQVMAFLKAKPKARMQLEIKPEVVDDAALSNIIDLAVRYGVKSRISVISFGAAPLGGIKRLDPGVRTGILSSGRLTAATVMRYASTIHLAQRAVTPAYVALMHRHGIAVNTWVVDKLPKWRRSVRMGVDSITTNTIPTLRHFCASR